nr:unnamed protein product [Callosobruchus chinensis]
MWKILCAESAGRQLKLRNTSSSIVLPCPEAEAGIWKLSRRREDRTRKYFSPSNFLKLYKAQVRPSLEYCSHIWGAAAPTPLSILNADLGLPPPAASSPARRAAGVTLEKRAEAGVGCIINKDWVKYVQNTQYVNERIIKVELNVNNEVKSIITAYGPSESEKIAVKEDFWENLSVITENSRGNVYIIGDFNGRVGKNIQTVHGTIGTEGEDMKNNNGVRLIQFCIENQYIITNTFFKHKDIHKYTREVKSRGEKSIIDYVLVPKQNRSEVKDVRVKRGSELFSDHYLLVARIKSGVNIERGEEFAERKVKFETIKMYKLKEPDTAKKFRDDVEEKISYIYDNAGDWNVEKTWQTLKKNLLDAAKKVCGVMKVNKNIKQTAWWTAEIKQEVKKKKKKWREFLQKKSVEAYNDYKRQRKKVKDLVSKAKAKSWEDFGNQMEKNSQGNQKLFYNILNKIRDKKPPRSSAVKDKQGNTLTDLKDMEMRWKEYFHELLCTEDPEKPVKQQIGNIDSDPETIEMYELLEAIQKIKVGKAAGHDNIKPEIIKALGPKGRTMLLSLYLKVWESGVVPKDWEVGVIIPIFKKGDPKDCGNYRGITLLSTVVKTFERILERKLYSKVEHELLDSQSGFRKGFSTQDHTFTIKQIISKTLEQNKEAYIAYLDLEKAFDRVERNKVWEILTRRKVGGKLIRAIQGREDQNLGERISGAGKLFWALNRSCFSKRELSIKTKLKVYKTLVLPVLLWGSESWVLSKRMKQQLQTMEMKFLRRIKGVTRADRIRNEDIRKELGIESVADLLERNQLKWFGHMCRMDSDRQVRKVWDCKTLPRRGRGRPTTSWNQVVEEVIVRKGQTGRNARKLAMDRKQWQNLVYGAN